MPPAPPRADRPARHGSTAGWLRGLAALCVAVPLAVSGGAAAAFVPSRDAALVGTAVTLARPGAQLSPLPHAHAVPLVRGGLRELLADSPGSTSGPSAGGARPPHAVAFPSTVSFGSPADLGVAGLPTRPRGRLVFVSDGHRLCSTRSLGAPTCRTHRGLDVGTHRLRASYLLGEGSSARRAWTRPTTLRVVPASTPLTAAVTQRRVPLGTSTTVSFAGLPVTGADAATGVVRFRDTRGTRICSVTLPGTSCRTRTALALGRHAVRAHYTGDPHYRPANSTRHRLVVTARQDATRTAVRSAAVHAVRGLGADTTPATDTADATPASVTYGHSQDVVVSFTGPDTTGAPPGASVSFTHDGDELCRATLPTTSCSVPAGLDVGSYPVLASYHSAPGQDDATASTSFTITPAVTTLSASVTGASVAYGTPETLSATLGGDVGPQPPGGTIRFTDIDTDGAEELLCAATLPQTSCATSSSVPGGIHDVTATYSGDASYQSATATTTFVVRKVAADLSVTSRFDYQHGTSMFLVASLADGASGTVRFERTSGALLCRTTLPQRGCWTSGALHVGTYPVRVRYAGDRSHDGDTATSSLLVTKQAYTMQARLSLPDGVHGKRVRLHVVGVPHDATGTVTMRADRTARPVRDDASATTVTLCTFRLPATSCVNQEPLVRGTYDVHAIYPGDADHRGASAETGFRYVTIPVRHRHATVHHGRASTPLPSGTGVKVSLVTPPAHGRVGESQGRLVYLADAGYVGPDRVVYQVEYPSGKIIRVQVDYTAAATSGTSGTGHHDRTPSGTPGTGSTTSGPDTSTPWGVVTDTSARTGTDAATTSDEPAVARVVTDGGVKALPETGNPVGVPLFASGIALVVLGGGVSVTSRRRNRHRPRHLAGRRTRRAVRGARRLA